MKSAQTALAFEGLVLHCSNNNPTITTLTRQMMVMDMVVVDVKMDNMMVKWEFLSCQKWCTHHLRG
jgi:hypothetical protein